MKKFFILILLVNNAFANQVIELDKPVKAKNSDIIKHARRVMEFAAYWEDEGYEYEITEANYPVFITKIVKDKNGSVVELELIGAARSGGFGWHSGYQRGTTHCTISLYKSEGSWANANGDADCETELDFD